MDKLNRRVIYLSDEEWADAQKRGAESKTTASAAIREALRLTSPNLQVVVDQMNETIKAARHESASPFIAYNPAPKVRAKR